MAGVTFDWVVKKYGDVLVVDDLTLQINDQEFLVLVGPSGCGKSTALTAHHTIRGFNARCVVDLNTHAYLAEVDSIRR